MVVGCRGSALAAVSFLRVCLDGLFSRALFVSAWFDNNFVLKGPVSTQWRMQDFSQGRAPNDGLVHECY